MRSAEESARNPAQGPATMKDVADLAGVGLSTVSRVVSGKGSVSSGTRTAIEAAIEELNFRRNDVARILRTGSTHTIGIVVRAISDPFYASLISAVEKEARLRDMLVLVADGTDDPEECARIIRRLLRRRLDGIIITPPDATSLHFLEREHTSGTSFVFVDSPALDLDADSVLTNNVGGAAQAVSHLLANGHTRIACLAHISGAYTSEQRRAGYRSALESAAVAYDDALVRVLPDESRTIVAALTEFAALAEPPTAVFTTNSRMTRAALRAFRQIDSDWAIAGFDDFEMAELTSPAITAVAQDPVASGELAARLLFERISGESGPGRRVVVGTRLLVRESSAPRHV